MFYNLLSLANSGLSYNNFKIKKGFLPLFLAIIVHYLMFLILTDNYQQPLIVNLQKIQVNFSQSMSIASSKVDYNNIIEKKEANNFVDKKKAQHNVNDFTREPNKINQNLQNSISNYSSKSQVGDSGTITSPVFDAEYLNNPSPIYPLSAKNNNIQGKVLLSVLVGAEGRAIEVKIANSSGYSILDNSALSAVRKWQFIPAKKNGEAMSATVIVPVEFKII